MKRALLVLALGAALLVVAVPARAQARADDLQFVETNGVRLAYRIIGEGEPLLLLHGFLQTDRTWRPIFDDLAADYALIVPQLRGHGRSTNPSGTFTHREAARDVFGLLDTLGIDRVRAVGYSAGGMTLLHMATMEPERVTAMVLVSATSYFPEPAREVMRAMAPDSVSVSWLDGIGRLHGGGVEQARALLSIFNGFKDSYEDMNFTPPLLSTITARTLVVHGDRDRFFPVSIPVEQYEAIPDSYLLILPNSGHQALPRDPEGLRYFVATLRRFLSGDWSCPAFCRPR